MAISALFANQQGSIMAINALFAKQRMCRVVPRPRSALHDSPRT